MNPREQELEAALKELCRLKRLRDEIGVRQKNSTISSEDLRRALLKYGREKDAAWQIAYKLVEN
jgi:hypothetical protein